MSTTLTVTSTSWVTPMVRRLHLRADDLSGFAESVFTDRYVKLAFPKPGVVYPERLDVRALRGTMPAEDLPDVRTYTALFPDVAAGTLAIDFVVHGDEGIAGPWAARARPGDTLVLDGPGGAYRPDPTADWHLLAGDESALPAILAALDDLAPDATVRVVLQVQKPGYEPELALPAGGEAVFLYRDDPDADGALLRAIRALDRPAGRVHAFVHGEAQAVMHEVRPYLLKELGIPRSDVSISGYWREGRTESGFREWKAELRRAEEGATA
jgi:NADPH-dependent ferric siderophore reductase